MAEQSEAIRVGHLGAHATPVLATVGREWIIECRGCDAALLRDVDVLRGLCARVVAEMGLHVVGEPLWHRFGGPGGVTGLYLLSESHLACHTYPEFGAATFNLYTCGDKPAWPWRQQLTTALAAREVVVRSLERELG